MISDSHYWKEDLLKQSAAIRKRAAQQRWTAASNTHFEQSVMLGFYSVLKLLESHLLCDGLARKKIALTEYPLRKRTMTTSDWVHFEDMYDLAGGKKAQHDLAFLCHQFVHSYVFAACLNDDNSLKGILVTSDHQKKKALYFVGIETVIDIFEAVGHDQP